MKPFDLEAALAGKPVVTRDGRGVTQIHKFTGPESNVVGIISDLLHSFHEDGSYYGSYQENSTDLFMKSDTKTIWINLYPDGAMRHHSEQAANTFGSASRLGGKAFPITYEV